MKLFTHKTEGLAIIFLALGLPVLIWSVMTGRFDIRNRADEGSNGTAITPTPSPTLTPTPTVIVTPTGMPTSTPSFPLTCDWLAGTYAYEFNTCAGYGYSGICFNKHNGTYQGCSQSDGNGCTYNNVYANQNIVCNTNYYPPATIQPFRQLITIGVRFAGVSGGEAEGAKISVKFVLAGGTVRQLSQPLTLTYSGTSGNYYASTYITNPFPAGTKFRIKIKGEKHIAQEFCKTYGQTTPCQDEEYIQVPNPVPIYYGFTLHSWPLSPGDLPPQDGKVDKSDIDKVSALMSKLCTDLTAEEKLTGDVDYNGCINVRDIFLIRQTLETRYD